MTKNTYKTYRLVRNDPYHQAEVKLVDEFNKFTDLDVSRFVYGADSKGNPNSILNNNGIKIAVSLIQWLGTPVGKAFLKDCGFEYTQ